MNEVEQRYLGWMEEMGVNQTTEWSYGKWTEEVGEAQLELIAFIQGDVPEDQQERALKALDAVYELADVVFTSIALAHNLKEEYGLEFTGIEEIMRDKMGITEAKYNPQELNTLRYVHGWTLEETMAYAKNRWNGHGNKLPLANHEES